MSDQHDLRRIARAMPEALEQGNGYRVGGKLFVWFYPERVHPKRPRVTNYEVVVLAVPSLDDKDALLAGDPDTYFATAHYDGFKAVLVRLARVTPDELEELVRIGWRAVAPPEVRERHEPGGQGAVAGSATAKPARKSKAKSKSKPATKSSAKATSTSRSASAAKPSGRKRAKPARAKRP